MIIVVFFLISMALGVIPAYLARRMKRNFVLWWVYSALFLPVALIHIVLLKLKLKFLMVFVVVLLVIYIIVGFYFIEWYVTTQPQARAEAALVRAKYLVASHMLENPGSLAGVSPETVPAFFAAETGLPREDLEKALATFNSNILRREDSVKEYAVELLISIREHYDYVESRGEFSDSSVPMGAAEEVFRLYIEALKQINASAPGLTLKYPADDPAKQASLTRLFEKNHMAMLKTEAMFFKTTTNAAPFLDRLDKEVEQADSKDRLLELVEYFEEIGDIFAGNREAARAGEVYQQAVDILYLLIDEYERGQLAAESEENKREAINFNILSRYSHIADIYEKTGDSAGIIKAFEHFLATFFESGIYQIEKEFFRLEHFVKTKTIQDIRKNRKLAVAGFLEALEKYKALNETLIRQLEIKFFTSVFLDFTKEERAEYAENVQDAYEFLVAAREIEDTKTVEEAYNFFKEFNQPEIIKDFMQILEELEPGLEEFETRIIMDKYPVYQEKIGEALETVEEFLVEHVALDGEKRTLLRDLNLKVRDLYDTISADVTLVLRGKKRIEAILMKPVSLERINAIDAKIRNERNAFIDIWRALIDEDKILTEDYAKMLKTCQDITKLADSIESGDLPNTSRNRNNLESMRRAVKNTNLRIADELEHIRSIKEAVGEKYDTEISSRELEEALAELQRQEEIADVDFRKVFPDGLPRDRRADLE